MMFRKGIMRKDTEMMTGNILDQSQRNKIIKDNQACSSGKALTVLPGTWKEFPRAAELQLEYVLGTTRENGKEQIAWSMKQHKRELWSCAIIQRLNSFVCLCVRWRLGFAHI